MNEKTIQVEPNPVQIAESKIHSVSFEAKEVPYSKLSLEYDVLRNGGYFWKIPFNSTQIARKRWIEVIERVEDGFIELRSLFVVANK